MARPTKLTPDTQQRITQAIQLGATYELAALYGGVTYATFYNWMKAGEEAKSGALFDFFNAVKAAEGKAAVQWLAKIEAAANDGAWQAAAWKLERRYPNEYGRTVQEQQHTGKDGAPIIQIGAVDYRAAIATLSAGPMGDSAAPGEGEDPRGRPALGQVDDGGQLLLSDGGDGR